MGLNRPFYDNGASGNSLAPWSFTSTKQGKVKKILEYMDYSTGEIIPADSSGVRQVNMGKTLLERERVINNLRPEVQQFACFLLKFRNKRRGISPGTPTICQWYANLTGQQTSHVRRYVKRLQQVGIIAGENLLGSIWQRTGGRPRGHAGEDARAEITYLLESMKWQNRPPKGQDRPTWINTGMTSVLSDATFHPSWMEHAEPTGNLLPYEAYAALMQRITGRPPLLDPHTFALGVGRSISQISLVEDDVEWCDWKALRAFRQAYRTQAQQNNHAACP